MTDNSGKSKKNSRKSLRLKDYDYREPGGYFITICTNEMRKIFGKITSGEMYLNRFGCIAREDLKKLYLTYPDVEIFNDEFVIMPNHVHVIIWIRNVGATHRVARKPVSRLEPQSLGAIIGQYKSRVTKEINRIRRTPGDRVWQRNYYDRIIRNEKELLTIKKYIEENPLRWEDDCGAGRLSFQ